jgi:hypothetical protein
VVAQDDGRPAVGPEGRLGNLDGIGQALGLPRLLEQPEVEDEVARGGV